MDLQNEDGLATVELIIHEIFSFLENGPILICKCPPENVINQELVIDDSERNSNDVEGADISSDLKHEEHFRRSYENLLQEVSDIVINIEENNTDKTTEEEKHDETEEYGNDQKLCLDLEALNEVRHQLQEYLTVSPDNKCLKASLALSPEEYSGEDFEFPVNINSTAVTDSESVDTSNDILSVTVDSLSDDVFESESSGILTRSLPSQQTDAHSIEGLENEFTDIKESLETDSLSNEIEAIINSYKTRILSEDSLNDDSNTPVAKSIGDADVSRECPNLFSGSSDVDAVADESYGIYCGSQEQDLRSPESWTSSSVLSTTSKESGSYYVSGGYYCSEESDIDRHEEFIFMEKLPSIFRSVSLNGNRNDSDKLQHLARSDSFNVLSDMQKNNSDRIKVDETEERKDTSAEEVSNSAFQEKVKDVSTDLEPNYSEFVKTYNEITSPVTSSTKTDYFENRHQDPSHISFQSDIKMESMQKDNSSVKRDSEQVGDSNEKSVLNKPETNETLGHTHQDISQTDSETSPTLFVGAACAAQETSNSLNVSEIGDQSISECKKVPKVEELECSNIEIMQGDNLPRTETEPTEEGLLSNTNIEQLVNEGYFSEKVLYLSGITNEEINPQLTAEKLEQTSASADCKSKEIAIISLDSAKISEGKTKICMENASVTIDQAVMSRCHAVYSDDRAEFGKVDAVVSSSSVDVISALTAVSGDSAVFSFDRISLQSRGYITDKDMQTPNTVDYSRNTTSANQNLNITEGDTESPFAESGDIVRAEDDKWNGSFERKDGNFNENSNVFTGESDTDTTADILCLSTGKAIGLTEDLDEKIDIRKYHDDNTQSESFEESKHFVPRKFLLDDRSDAGSITKQTKNDDITLAYFNDNKDKSSTDTDIGFMENKCKSQTNEDIFFLNKEETAVDADMFEERQNVNVVNEHDKTKVETVFESTKIEQNAQETSEQIDKMCIGIDNTLKEQNLQLPDIQEAKCPEQKEYLIDNNKGIDKISLLEENLVDNILCEDNIVLHLHENINTDKDDSVVVVQVCQETDVTNRSEREFNNEFENQEQQVLLQHENKPTCVDTVFKTQDMDKIEIIPWSQSMVKMDETLSEEIKELENIYLISNMFPGITLYENPNDDIKENRDTEAFIRCESFVNQTIDPIELSDLEFKELTSVEFEILTLKAVHCYVDKFVDIEINAKPSSLCRQCFVFNDYVFVDSVDEVNMIAPNELNHGDYKFIAIGYESCDFEEFDQPERSMTCVQDLCVFAFDQVKIEQVTITDFADMEKECLTKDLNTEQRTSMEITPGKCQEKDTPIKLIMEDKFKQETLTDACSIGKMSDFEDSCVESDADSDSEKLMDYLVNQNHLKSEKPVSGIPLQDDFENGQFKEDGEQNSENPQHYSDLIPRKDNILDLKQQVSDSFNNGTISENQLDNESHSPCNSEEKDGRISKLADIADAILGDLNEVLDSNLTSNEADSEYEGSETADYSLTFDLQDDTKICRNNDDKGICEKLNEDSIPQRSKEDKSENVIISKIKDSNEKLPLFIQNQQRSKTIPTENDYDSENYPSDIDEDLVVDRMAFDRQNTVICSDFSPNKQRPKLVKSEHVDDSDSSLTEASISKMPKGTKQQTTSIETLQTDNYNNNKDGTFTAINKEEEKELVSCSNSLNSDTTTENNERSQFTFAEVVEAVLKGKNALTAEPHNTEYYSLKENTPETNTDDYSLPASVNIVQNRADLGKTVSIREENKTDSTTQLDLPEKDKKEGCSDRYTKSENLVEKNKINIKDKVTDHVKLIPVEMGHTTAERNQENESVNMLKKITTDSGSSEITETVDKQPYSTSKGKEKQPGRSHRRNRSIGNRFMSDLSKEISKRPEYSGVSRKMYAESSDDDQYSQNIRTAKPDLSLKPAWSLEQSERFQADNIPIRRYRTKPNTEILDEDFSDHCYINEIGSTEEVINKDDPLDYYVDTDTSSTLEDVRDRLEEWLDSQSDDSKASFRVKEKNRERACVPKEHGWKEQNLYAYETNAPADRKNEGSVIKKNTRMKYSKEVQNFKQTKKSTESNNSEFSQSYTDNDSFTSSKAEYDNKKGFSSYMEEKDRIEPDSTAAKYQRNYHQDTKSHFEMDESSNVPDVKSSKEFARNKQMKKGLIDNRTLTKDLEENKESHLRFEEKKLSENQSPVKKLQAYDIGSEHKKGYNVEKNALRERKLNRERKLRESHLQRSIESSFEYHRVSPQSSDLSIYDPVERTSSDSRQSDKYSDEQYSDSSRNKKPSKYDYVDLPRKSPEERYNTQNRQKPRGILTEPHMRKFGDENSRNRQWRRSLSRGSNSGESIGKDSFEGTSEVQVPKTGTFRYDAPNRSENVDKRYASEARGSNYGLQGDRYEKGNNSVKSKLYSGHEYQYKDVKHLRTYETHQAIIKQREGNKNLISLQSSSDQGNLSAKKKSDQCKSVRKFDKASSAPKQAEMVLEHSHDSSVYIGRSLQERNANQYDERQLKKESDILNSNRVIIPPRNQGNGKAFYQDDPNRVHAVHTYQDLKDNRSKTTGNGSKESGYRKMKIPHPQGDTRKGG